MPTGHFLDSQPIWAVFLLFVVLALLVFEIGFRFGLWRQKRSPDEIKGLTGMLVGSLLALIAFLLAFTVGMASSRFDARRQLVLAEANAVGTTYLRAGYLPDGADQEIRNLLREYVPLRVSTPDNDLLVQQATRAGEILDELWARAETLARSYAESTVLPLFIDSLNQTIDLYAERNIVSVYARVPETILYMLVAGGLLAFGMVGYNAGLTQKHSLAGTIIFVIVMAAVITLVFDLDRPRDGTLVISQQALLDLQADIGAPQD